MTKFIGTRLTLPNLATAPSSPAAGDAYYNTVSNTVYVYNGTSWVDLAGASGGTVYYQAGLPTSPADGDIWIDSDDDVAGVSALTDSTSTTSSVLAASATAVKSAYDLAAAAVPKSTVTTAGDVIYATGSAAVARLGIGTTGQVLSVVSGAPSWTTVPAGASVQEFTSSGTWTKPSGHTAVYVMAVGGGGGGGGGGTDGAGGGGSGGLIASRVFPSSEFGATVSVTVGAGGTGGVGITGTCSSTSDGTYGGGSSFGSDAFYVEGGSPGLSTNNSRITSAPLAVYTANSYNLLSSATLSPLNLEGRGGVSGTSGTASAKNGRDARFSAGGGGAGNGDGASANAGGNGGRGLYSYGTAPAGGAGAANGTAASIDYHGGGGGGGGVTTAGNGAAGRRGGGGGGGGRGTTTGGSGGAGGDGYVLVISW